MRPTDFVPVVSVKLILLYFFFYKANAASSGYTADFEILEFVNSEGRLFNGECCSGYKSTLGHGLCRGGNATCKPYWKICLTQHYPVDKNGSLIMPSRRKHDIFRQAGPRFSVYGKQAPTTPNNRPSMFKAILSKILGSIGIMQLGNDIPLDNFVGSDPPLSPCSVAFWSTEVITSSISKGEPMKLKANVPKSFFLKRNPLSQLVSSWKTNGTGNAEIYPLQQNVLVFVEIWHKQPGSPDNDKLIARHIEQQNVSLISNIWHHGGTTQRKINGSNSVHFKYRWRLQEDIDASTKETTATPACPAGFSGPSCDQPICLKGCHKSHGYCDKPGECKCKFGWTGKYCSVCVPMPGCVHGSCIKPFECRCEEGWNSMFCDKPTCKTGCHPQNGYCEHPGECRCRFGYKGENCTECSTMPGCQNGGCVKPLDCNCFEGWDGIFCSIPRCNSGCDNENGWCRRPNECRCRVGWTGKNCTECVPYPGCEHGKCSSSPWTCNCEPGWGGITCSERLDWCQKNKSPCLNGGVCISVEKADNSYICQCALGYEGRHCEKLKN